MESHQDFAMAMDTVQTSFLYFVRTMGELVDRYNSGRMAWSAFMYEYDIRIEQILRSKREMDALDANYVKWRLSQDPEFNGDIQFAFPQRTWRHRQEWK